MQNVSPDKHFLQNFSLEAPKYAPQNSSLWNESASQLRFDVKNWNWDKRVWSFKMVSLLFLFCTWSFIESCRGMGDTLTLNSPARLLLLLAFLATGPSWRCPAPLLLWPAQLPSWCGSSIPYPCYQEPVWSPGDPGWTLEQLMQQLFPQYTWLAQSYFWTPLS